MRTYIVTVSPAYGGAEKRFFDIYTGLRRQGADVFYIAPSMLLDRLLADHADRSDVAEGMIPVRMHAWSAARFVWRYAALLRSLPRPATFHYPMNCLWPLHATRGDVVTLSLVDCTNPPRLTLRDRQALQAYVALRFAKRIDVLSPAVFRHVRRFTPGKKATLTPGGTFLLPPRSIEAPKPPTVTLFGRLVEDKGILDFLDVLPAVWQHLEPRAPAGFAIEVAGYGPLEGVVGDRARTLRESGVPVEFVGYQTADDLLARSAVVLSLQRTTNYPSRVVAEALLGGCAVVVRATGDSDAFGRDLPGLVYCDAELEPVALADTIAGLLGETRSADFCQRIHSAARTRFCSPGYLDYFEQVVFEGVSPGEDR